MSDKFRYTYSAPTDGERKEIERIRREYLPDAHGEKMTRLRALHARVRNVPMALAVTLGVAGVLLFGLGMSMVLVWNLLLAGSAVAAVHAGSTPPIRALGLRDQGPLSGRNNFDGFGRTGGKVMSNRHGLFSVDRN